MVKFYVREERFEAAQTTELTITLSPNFNFYSGDCASVSLYIGRVKRSREFVYKSARSWELVFRIHDSEWRAPVEERMAMLNGSGTSRSRSDDNDGHARVVFNVTPWNSATDQAACEDQTSGFSFRLSGARRIIENDPARSTDELDRDLEAPVARPEDPEVDKPEQTHQGSNQQSFDNAVDHAKSDNQSPEQTDEAPSSSTLYEASDYAAPINAIGEAQEEASQNIYYDAVEHAVPTKSTSEPTAEKGIPNDDDGTMSDAHAETNKAEKVDMSRLEQATRPLFQNGTPLEDDPLMLQSPSAAPSPVPSTWASADPANAGQSTPMQIADCHVPSSPPIVKGTSMPADKEEIVPQSPSAETSTLLPKEEAWPREASPALCSTLSASTPTNPATGRTVKVAREDNLSLDTPTQKGLPTAQAEHETTPATVPSRDLEKRRKQMASKAQHKNAGKEVLNDLRKRIEENDEKLEKDEIPRLWHGKQFLEGSNVECTAANIRHRDLINKQVELHYLLVALRDPDAKLVWEGTHGWDAHYVDKYEEGIDTAIAEAKEHKARYEAASSSPPSEKSHQRSGATSAVPPTITPKITPIDDYQAQAALTSVAPQTVQRPTAKGPTKQHNHTTNSSHADPDIAAFMQTAEDVGVTYLQKGQGGDGDSDDNDNGSDNHEPASSSDKAHQPSRTAASGPQKITPKATSSDHSLRQTAPTSAKPQTSQRSSTSYQDVIDLCDSDDDDLPDDPLDMRELHAAQRALAESASKTAEYRASKKARLH